MTHTRPMADSEGEFSGWSPAAEKCRACGSELHVWVRLWESSDGAFEDYQYRCWNCKSTWWVEGIEVWP